MFSGRTALALIVASFGFTMSPNFPLRNQPICPLGPGSEALALDQHTEPVHESARETMATAVAAPAITFSFSFVVYSRISGALKWRRFIQTKCVMSASLLEELR
jgi:hypothetical protein